MVEDPQFTGADVMAVPVRTPTISVVIPTHNRPRMLTRALDSVLAQTFDQFEVVVVDDGSQQPVLLRGRPADDPRVRMIRRCPSAGAAAARNAGIALARAPLIAFLDDDDEFLPDHLECTLRVWQTAPLSAGLAWTGVQRVFANRTLRCEARPGQEDLLDRFLTIGCGFGVSMSARLLRQLGEFDPALRMVEDTDLFLRMLTAGNTPMVVPGVHIRNHEHSGPRLTSSGNAEQRRREYAGLLHRHDAYLCAHPTLELHLRRHILPGRLALPLVARGCPHLCPLPGSHRCPRPCRGSSSPPPSETPPRPR